MRTDFIKIEDLDTLGRNVNKMFSDVENFKQKFGYTQFRSPFFHQKQSKTAKNGLKSRLKH